MSDAIHANFAAWGETDPARRAELIAASVGASFYYADPNAPAPITSAQDYGDYLETFAAHMPGASATVVSVSTHHGHARATVDFIRDGTAMMRGQYFADLDAEGRILRLIGFPGTGEP